MGTVRSALRYALRQVRRSPGVAAVAMLTLPSALYFAAAPQISRALVGPQSAGLADTTEARITAFVERAIEDSDLAPGLSLAVVRGNEIVYQRGFGWADIERREPVAHNTIFYIASLSKALTAMAAVVLAAEGELDLDSPITSWFPGLRFEPPLPPASSRHVRHLLAHTPGFMNGAVNFVTTFVGPYEATELVCVLSISSTPVDGFVYSNMSYALVSYVIQEAAGAPWQDVLAERVFEPVGMHSTTAYASRLPSQGAAKPYERTEAGFEHSPPLKTDATITGAGGFFSTAADLARYVVANLNDGRIEGRQALPGTAVREAKRPQAPLDATFFEFRRHHYGLGLYLAEYDGETLVHHFGGIPGGFASHMSFIPEHEIGVVVLQNAANRLVDLVATYVYDLMLGRPDLEVRASRRLEAMRAAAVQAARTNSARRARLDSLTRERRSPELPLRAYAGAYENPRLGRLQVEPAQDGLRVRWGALEGRLLPAGGHDFLVEWQPGYPPWTWSFNVPADDRVAGFQWDQRTFARVEAQGSLRPQRCPGGGAA